MIDKPNEDLTANCTFSNMATALEQTGNYRVLRRVKPLPISNRTPSMGERLAIILDTETTGLNLEHDEVIEIGMLAVSYNISGNITNAVGSFEGLQQPNAPLTEEASRITGLKKSDLIGKAIDHSSLEAFLEPADILIAHNAAFDRPMCEKLNRRFKEKAWACSATEIDWAKLGFETAKLKYLLFESGYFYTAHRALNDCHALARILALDVQDRSLFARLVERARSPTFRIIARGEFEDRLIFRSRGYRWRPSEKNAPGHWEISLSKEAIDSEIMSLREIFEPRGNLTYSVERLTAFERHRSGKF